MDPLRLTIALGPLAVYLLVLGWMNLSRRPVVVNGARDLLALAIAVSGFVLVGPVELLMPLAAASKMGPVVWVLLIGLYGLVVILLAVLAKPRLLLYNITEEVARPLVADIALRLDGDARWAGETLVIPKLNVELRLEITPVLRNVALLANHERQSVAGWRVLEAALRAEMRRIEVPPNLQGLSMITFSMLVMGLLLFTAARDPAGIAQSFFEMLRF
jgi:hypothetical protein